MVPSAPLPIANTDIELHQGNDESADAPSGFILKLFQMVSGPDEIISWTPNGDAFVIGSDLQRLESETLPKYFRHNRFQSLVRQLNFYSFRKINRERNVWIYQHPLFHRDRKDDLHLVRRRTCPGLDGRKQRFSRLNRKPVSPDSDDDESSTSSTSSTQVESAVSRKREASDDDFGSIKRPRRMLSPHLQDALDYHTQVTVDASLVKVSKPTLVEDPEEILAPLDSKIEKFEMREQSMIVSEVAEKLEQFARKALGRSRSRRGNTGVITPPYGTQGTFTATSLLTYDDEQFEVNEESSWRCSSASSLGLVSQSEVGEDEDTSFVMETKPVTPLPMRSPPVRDNEMIEAVSQRLLEGSPPHLRDGLKPHVAVAAFCMSTAPCGDESLASKILRLIASCNSLMSDFQNYRAALHPVIDGPVQSSTQAFTPQVRPIQGLQIWEKTSSRSDAVHDFKIFAVNCIHKFLGRGNPKDMTLLSPCDRTILKRTVDLWQESACL